MQLRGMRILLLVLWGLAAASLPASAQKKVPAGTEVDRGTSLVLDDGNGYYMVVSKIGSDESYVYGGYGTTLSKQYVRSGTTDSRTGGYERNIWAPRSVRVSGRGKTVMSMRGSRDPRLGLPGSWTVATAYRLSSSSEDKERKAFLKKAVFTPREWRYRVRHLARDEEGIYYLIDLKRGNQRRAAFKGYRLFKGKRGAMKEIGLTKVVADSQVFCSSRSRGFLP